MYKYFLILFSLLFFFSSTMASEIVYKDNQGNVLSKKDLTSYTGTARWEIISHRTISNEAFEYHRKARMEGRQGNYKKSIDLCIKASKLDPKWPYPIYDMAYTYLLMGNIEKSYSLYSKVDKMEPRGFFTTKTALYTLEGEIKGTFPQGLYLTYIGLEWMEYDKKIEALINLVNKIPNYAPTYKELISVSRDDKSALSAIEQGLSCNPDMETFGILMVNKALILHRNDLKSEAIKILSELALSKKSTWATEKIAKETLASILSGQ